MRLRPGLLIGALALAAACRSHPATQVVVFFHADTVLGGEAARLAVEVEGPDGVAVLTAENPVASTTAGALARVPLVPRDGDASRTFRIQGRLLADNGDELASVEAITGYREDELVELHLWFDSACRGMLDCGPGRTCSRGVCVGSCFEASPGEGEALRSEPTCGECQECSAGACVSVQDATPCGCADTDSCGGGTCVSPVQVWSASGGLRHTCATVMVGQSSLLYCWGANNVGELGTGGGASSSPVTVALDAAGSVVAATDNTCARDFAGGRSCWGWNGNGELGNGLVADTATVTPLAAPSGDPPWAGLDSGWYHYCGVTLETTPRLLCWGLNDHGQAGGDPVTIGAAVTAPHEVMSGSGWTEAAAGGFASCGIREDGTLWCWGLNWNGELGVGDGVDRTTPAQSGCVDGICYDDWKEVARGDFHTCAVRDNGELWCWGADTSGQLGIGEVRDEDSAVRSPMRALLDRWNAVEAGQSHSCGLRDDGSLWCWGANDKGQLGVGDTLQRPSPAQVLVPGGGQWTQVAPGRDHTCAIRSDQTLWCWGLNEQGQLGLGFETLPGDPLVTTPRRVCMTPPP